MTTETLRRARDLFFVFLLMCGIPGTMVFIFMVGQAHGPQIPHCQEDEHLIAVTFPYTDATNLRCVHVESYVGDR